MKKETIIAVILGIGTGVIIAVLIIANSQKNNTSQAGTYEPATITPEITFEPKKTEPLLITSPIDKAIIANSSVLITGKAPKGSLIVVQSPYNEIAKKTTSSEFKLDFELEEGENIIEVTQYLDKTIDNRKITLYKITN